MRQVSNVQAVRPRNDSLANALDTTHKWIKSKDKFGRGFGFKMDAGVGQIRTKMGTCCTLIWVIIILVYAMQKLDTLIFKKQISILSSKKELYFSETDRFTYDQGLNFAVGYTAFDNETEWTLDPRYGEIVINSFSWGFSEDQTPYTERKPIGMHNCTKEELGLEGDPSKSRFHTVDQASAYSINFYWRKLLCVDEKDMYIMGDYNSETARQLNVQLRKCEGPDCFSEAEILKYFKNRFLLLYANQAYFATDKFG